MKLILDLTTGYTALVMSLKITYDDCATQGRHMSPVGMNTH